MMNRPFRPTRTALLAALAVTGLVTTCLAQTPRVSDALRRTADEVGRLEREADALKRENADLRRKQLAQATPVPPSPAPAKADANAADLGITVVAAGTMAPATVHLCGLSATPGGATPLTARYDWTFSDAAGTVVRKSVGWNAAAVLDRPGDYIAALAVTSSDGARQTYERMFVVAPDTRRTVHVAADGSDANAGASPASAVRSLGRAVALAGSDARVLLRRGDTFAVPEPVKLAGRNLCLRAFGDAGKPLPKLLWSGGKPNAGEAILQIEPSADGLLIENLEFDAPPLDPTQPDPNKPDTDKQTVPTAIRAGGGRNLTIRGCRFLNVNEAFNGNGQPTGVLVRGNVAPSPTGVRGYFVWGAGTDYVVEDNVVANSTREHVVRLSQMRRITITGNRLTNLDRTAQGDPYDAVKGVITVQFGDFAYVSGNVLPSGAVNLGPLSGRDGAKSPGNRWDWAVVENNRVGQTLEVKSGTSHVAVRGNRIGVDGDVAVLVEGFDADYGRGVSDLTIDRNTGVNGGERGNFLKLQGRAEGVSLTNNLYVAPALQPGGFNTAAVFVGQSDLSSFSAIAGNVWPTARPSSYARGGVCFVGATMSSDGFLTPTAWNALPAVRGDRFLPLARPGDAPPGVGCDPSAVPSP